MVLSQGRVSLEQRLGTALQTEIILILSLSLSLLFLKSDLLETLTYTIPHTHTSRLPRLSSPGLGSLLSHQNQKMLSSINWLRQLIARDKAKQPQLKIQLTKSHESSQPTIGRDISDWAFLSAVKELTVLGAKVGQIIRGVTFTACVALIIPSIIKSFHSLFCMAVKLIFI